MLYLAFSWLGKYKLMRAPTAGGPSQVLIGEPSFSDMRCTRLPVNVCVVDGRSADQQQLIFYSLDPLKGKGQELTRISVDLKADRYSWDLSPDGSRIAIVIPSRQEGRIRIASLRGAKGEGVQDVIVQGWADLSNLDWSPDGNGWYTSSHAGTGWALLHVDLGGHASLLHQEQIAQDHGIWGLASPDGRYLAFLNYTSANNVWMIEGL